MKCKITGIVNLMSVKITVKAVNYQCKFSGFNKF